MAWPEDPLDLLVKGARPTLLEAEKGNEILNALNVLGAITIEKGAKDEVLYSDAGIKITYGIGFAFSGSVTVLNPLDITQQFVITFQKGEVKKVEQEASDYETKEVTICEDGAEATY